MAAAYDTYDYPSYWEGREYEHESEAIALREFLSKIPKIDTILEIGAGFGRLVPIYSFRARKIIISDPSSKLLKIARENFGHKKNVAIMQAGIEALNTKIRSRSVDLVVMVRVLHHLSAPEDAFSLVSRVLKNNGYFILEVANKRHLKATLKEFLKGNITFPLDIFPKDVRSKKSIKNKTIPFMNYHPELIKHELGDFGFTIVEVRSVSNIRNTKLKSLFPTETLLAFEKPLQRPLSLINFGPSIFILAQKRT